MYRLRSIDAINWRQVKFVFQKSQENSKENELNLFKIGAKYFDVYVKLNQLVLLLRPKTLSGNSFRINFQYI